MKKYEVTNSTNDKTSIHKSVVAAKQAAEEVFQCKLAQSERQVRCELRSRDIVVVTPILGFKEWVIIEKIS